MIAKPNNDFKNINKNTFYAFCNNKNSPINKESIWNGIIIVINILYTFSPDNLNYEIIINHKKTIIKHNDNKGTLISRNDRSLISKGEY